jgi:gamma-glutamylcyclotransferase (GGCT)/AIG2-like uncharacterized protein YtfP
MNIRYFAYGSNLNEADWHRWCREKGFAEGLLRPLFTAFLPDRALGFTAHSTSRKGGALDVVPAKGHLVEGVVFEVADGGWDALDRKEGAPKYYRAIDMEALTFDGAAHPVRTYEVVPGRREAHVPPHEEYLDVIRKGFGDHEISSDAFEEAAAGNAPGSVLTSLFAYGTLMRGESRWRLLSDRSKVALLAEAPGRLFDLGAFPGMRPDPDGSAFVRGEFVGLSNLDLLDELDRIEGFPGFETEGGLFRRRLTHVGMMDGRVRSAWVYVLADEGQAAKTIAEGDWRLHHGRRQDVLRALAQAHVSGQEDNVLQALRNRWSVCMPAAVTPPQIAEWVAEALGTGVISERQLAQASGRWAVSAARSAEANG